VNWAVRWGGLVAAALVLVTSEVSRTGDRKIALRLGGVTASILAYNPGYAQFMVGVADDPSIPSPAFRAALNIENDAAMIERGWSGRAALLQVRFWWVAIPMWPVIATPLTLSACAWWRWRKRQIRRRARALAGRCPSCGYDLSGLPTGSPSLPCPECGEVPKS
jgi:hypothetical protein